MSPPDWSEFEAVLAALIETIHIATLGTMVTVLIAFPVALLAARNTTFNTLTWTIGRFILVASRPVNTVCWALFFVHVFRPGRVAGAALGLEGVPAVVPRRWPRLLFDGRVEPLAGRVFVLLVVRHVRLLLGWVAIRGEGYHRSPAQCEGRRAQLSSQDV